MFNDLWSWLSQSDFHESYASNLRDGLFGGFLTLTGFLFSVKTFLLLQLDKDIYSTDAYRERIEHLRTINPRLTLYGPLRRLAQLLLAAVTACLITAVLQYSLGFFKYNWTALVCCGMAVLSLLLLFFCLAMVSGNIRDWMADAEKRAAKDRAEQTPASTDPVPTPSADGSTCENS